MIFSSKSIEDMLSGKKTMTRRLVKEEEKSAFQITQFGKDDENNNIKIVFSKNKRVKWQVGRDYAVQSGRGRKGLWYCPKCKELDGQTKRSLPWYYDERGHPFCPKCFYSHEGNDQCIEPLRIKITGIRKERLLDISEEDAKREGFETRAKFIDAFYKLNKRENIKWNKSFPNYNPYIHGMYNPDVWVLEIVEKEAEE